MLKIFELFPFNFDQKKIHIKNNENKEIIMKIQLKVFH